VYNRQRASKIYSGNSSRLPSPAADKLVDLAVLSPLRNAILINSYTCPRPKVMIQLATILSHDHQTGHILLFRYFSRSTNSFIFSRVCVFFLLDLIDLVWQYSNQQYYLSKSLAQTEVNFFLFNVPFFCFVVFGLGHSPCEHVSETSRAFQNTHAFLMTSHTPASVWVE
jgi:hypothetical protein